MLSDRMVHSELIVNIVTTKVNPSQLLVFTQSTAPTARTRKCTPHITICHVLLEKWINVHLILQLHTAVKARSVDKEEFDTALMSCMILR